MKNYIRMWKNTFKFTGRASRAEYWHATAVFGILNGIILLLAILAAVLYVVNSSNADMLTNTANPDYANYVSEVTAVAVLGVTVVILLQILPFLSLQVRRLNDIGFPGLLYLVISAAHLIFVISILFKEYDGALGLLLLFNENDNDSLSSNVSLISTIINVGVIIMSVIKGQTGPNKYGADPYAPIEQAEKTDATQE